MMKQNINVSCNNLYNNHKNNKTDKTDVNHIHIHIYISPT